MNRTEIKERLDNLPVKKDWPKPVYTYPKADPDKVRIKTTEKANT